MLSCGLSVSVEGVLMKKLAATLMFLGAVLMSGAGLAHADSGFPANGLGPPDGPGNGPGNGLGPPVNPGNGGYPPGAAIVNIVRGSPGPVGTTFQVRVDGCLVGEEVVFTLPGNDRAPVRVICVDVSRSGTGSGSATATLTHPGRPGNYPGFAELLGSNGRLPFTILTTVDPSTPQIPPTGGGSSAQGVVTTGVGLLVLGGGLLIVARQRRRSAAAA